MRNAVLTIDLDHPTIDLLRVALHPKLRVDSVEEPADAIRLIIETNRVQLVIIQVSHNSNRGWDLCRHLKSFNQTEQLPILLLTKEEISSLQLQAFEYGADGIMPLNISRDLLSAAVNNLVDNRNRVRNYFSNHPRLVQTNCPDSAVDPFLEGLIAAVIAHMHNPDLNINLLARELHVSRPTLYRKIKQLTSLAPNELVMLTRLQKAAQLLAEGQFRVFEIANKVGFQSQSSFGKAFSRHFKITPTEYQRIGKQSRPPVETFLSAGLLARTG